MKDPGIRSLSKIYGHIIFLSIVTVCAGLSEDSKTVGAVFSRQPSHRTADRFLPLLPGLQFPRRHHILEA